MISRFQQEKAIFENKRLQKLIDRYKSFEYKYRMRDIRLYDNKICGKIRRECVLFGEFWHNYEQYWLNVYRPFDEYDMEANEESHKIMHGFKFLKPCLDCEIWCCLSAEDRARQKAMVGKNKKVKNKLTFKNSFKRKGELFGKCCSYLLDHTCNLCLFIAMCVIFISIFYLSSSLTESAVDGSGDSSWDSYFTITNNTDTSFYSICTTEFQPYLHSSQTGMFLVCLCVFFLVFVFLFFVGDVQVPESSKLSVLDLMFLMQAAYEMDNYNLTKMIDIYFNGSFEIVGASYTEPVWFQIAHKTAPLSVISVRGTDTLIDAMQDLSLFVEVSIFEGLEWIFPFLKFSLSLFFLFILNL